MRSGITDGYVLTYRDITDPSVPNCYEFSFSPKTFDGLKSMGEELVITEYHGDTFCTASGKITPVATLHVVVHQDEAIELEFPFLKGEQVRIELGQNWKVAL